MIKYCFIIVVFFAFAKANAQGTDLFRAEYTYFPQRNSDNSFRRFRTFVNIPLKVKEGTYFVPFLEYRNVHFLIRDNTLFKEFGTDRYESYEVSMGILFLWKKTGGLALELECLLLLILMKQKLLATTTFYLHRFILSRMRKNEKMEVSLGN